MRQPPILREYNINILAVAPQWCDDKPSSVCGSRWYNTNSTASTFTYATF